MIRREVGLRGIGWLRSCRLTVSRGILHEVHDHERWRHAVIALMNLLSDFELSSPVDPVHHFLSSIMR
jgi:hypothetical protein